MLPNVIWKDIDNTVSTRWSQWSVNCTAVEVGRYPMLIPEGTRVPAWAYLDVTLNDTFDPVAAIAVSSPELESIPVSVPSSTITSSSITTEKLTKTSSTTFLTLTRRDTRVSVIVGGVVGCIMALGIFGVIVFIVMGRREIQKDEKKRYRDIVSPTSLPRSATYATWSYPPRFRGEDNNPVMGSGSTQ
jgi:hypothetical protein